MVTGENHSAKFSKCVDFVLREHFRPPYLSVLFNGDLIRGNNETKTVDKFNIEGKERPSNA
jgi:hypothetical protein